MKRIYLDWAAAAPVLPAALQAYATAMAAFGNPSSPHTEGRASRNVLEAARTAIARELAVKSDDIVFTSGATEANNLAIQGRIEALHQEGREYAAMHVLYLPSSHASVIETVAALATRGVAAEPLPVREGRVDVAALAMMIRPETVLVSMDYVCGETGTIWNVREVRQAVLEAHKSGTVSAPITFHVDASQAPLVESVERTRLAADLLTLDAQKVGGVRGIGLLVAPRSVFLSPILFGGGQERDLRPGTQMPAHAAAFAVALVETRKTREQFAIRAQQMKDALLAQLTEISGLAVNAGHQSVPHILNVSFSGRDTDYLLALLDEAGFAVSTKSACESDSEQGSRSVSVLTGDAERAKATLRISWGPSTSARELARFADALIKAIRFIDDTKL